ncbi:hypothetical protein LSTR_LSTR008980 [Laodelphax striatellus]|uniref:WD repeat-containing protein 55 homolog n=1 Tax=Laodelphax striatellus TaxID=195883 RepID=A0A482WK00_LAOST|nr:hypothetical protein LSTR_LSTR008980 [Laodelphax striatellus]
MNTQVAVLLLVSSCLLTSAEDGKEEGNDDKKKRQTMMSPAGMMMMEQLHNSLAEYRNEIPIVEQPPELNSQQMSMMKQALGMMSKQQAMMSMSSKEQAMMSTVAKNMAMLQQAKDMAMMQEMAKYQSYQPSKDYSSMLYSKDMMSSSMGYAKDYMHYSMMDSYPKQRDYLSMMGYGKHYHHNDYSMMDNMMDHAKHHDYYMKHHDYGMGYSMRPMASYGYPSDFEHYMKPHHEYGGMEFPYFKHHGEFGTPVTHTHVHTHSKGSLVSMCLEQLGDAHWPLRQWLALCLGRLWAQYDKARWCGVRDTAHEKLYVRAAAVYALGTFISAETKERSEHANNIDQSVAMMLINTVSNDMSPLVRKVDVTASPVSGRGLVRNPSRDRLRVASLIGGDTVDGERLKRVQSSSSISSLNHSMISVGPFGGGGGSPGGGSWREAAAAAGGGVAAKVWAALVALDADPSPGVAQLARTVVDYIRDQISEDRAEEGRRAEGGGGRGLVSTQFVEWSCKNFAKPAAGQGDAATVDVESPEYYEREWSAWDYQSNTRVCSWRVAGGGGRPRVTALDFVNAHDTHLVAAGSDDGAVRLWGGVGAASQGPHLVTAWLALPANGEGAVASGAGAAKHQFAIGSQDAGGRQLLAAGYGDGSVRLFDRRLPPNEACVKTYREHSSWVVDVDLRTDNSGMPRLLSGCVAGDVRSFDTRHNSSELMHKTVHRMTAMATHRSADIFACVSANQLINIVDRNCSSAADRVTVIKYHEWFMTARFGPVSCLAFHPLRALLAAGSVDSTLVVYAPAADPRLR